MWPGLTRVGRTPFILSGEEAEGGGARHHSQKCAWVREGEEPGFWD